MLYAIFIFIVVLGILVFVHELGHFVAARIFKVGVDEFGFGYPPKIFGIKKGETEYSLNWIPVGGFVRIKGVVGADQADEVKKDNKQDDDNFINKPVWQRFVILFAGVFMNFILAGLLFSFGFIIGMPSAVSELPESARISNQQVVVIDTLEGTPAAESGIQSGDKIFKFNDNNVNNIIDFQNLFIDYSDEKAIISIDREGEIIEKEIKIEIIQANDDKKGIGVSLAESGEVSYVWYEAIYRGFEYTIILTGMILKALYGIIAGLIVTQQAGVDFSGPVGIAVITNQVAQLGFIYLLQFTALLSINLAIFNLLPIPALDGGRLIFLIIEKIKGKPVNQKIENVIHNVGFIFLMLLVVLVTFRDIFKYEIIDQVKNFFI